MAQKPDRFERIANKFFEHEGPFYAFEIADLLRKEHAWTRRMVKQVSARLSQFLTCPDDVVYEVLKRLNQRRK